MRNSRYIFYKVSLHRDIYLELLHRSIGENLVHKIRGY